jgi:basic membrane protein A
MERRGGVREVREPLLNSRRAALLLGGSALLAACSSARGHARNVTVGMVTDFGGLGDHSFNDSANIGLQQAKRRLGVGTVVLQSRSVSDYQLNMMALANEAMAEIFCIGYDEALDLGEVARRFPAQHFSIIDGVVDAPNVTSLGFRDQEGSFLAGALAALVSRRKIIGFLGGADVPIIQTFEAGYIAGARQIDPQLEVLVKYVGSFDDIAAGKELSATLYDGHADIIYAAAGKCVLGTISQAQARSGVFVIGVDSNQDALAPGKVLTSVLKRIDVSVFRMCELAAAHKPRPRHVVLGLRENGVGLTDFAYTRAIVTPAIVAQLDRIKAAVIGGKIRVPRTRAEAAVFRSVPL